MNKRREAIFEGHRHRAFIPLTQGYRVEVDWWLAEYLAQWNWQTKSGTHGVYAYRKEQIDNKVESVYMHRQLLGLKKGSILTGDHVNRNTTDNRICNLRKATMKDQANNRSQRTESSSATKGIYAHGKYFQAYIQGSKTRIYIGQFPTVDLAIEARDKATLLHRSSNGTQAIQHRAVQFHAAQAPVVHPRGAGSPTLP